MSATGEVDEGRRVRNCGPRTGFRPSPRACPAAEGASTPLPWVVDASDDDFPAVVDESSLPVLVDVWAPGAVPAGW